MNLFTVKLKNEPGTLATVAEAIARRGVDVRGVGGGAVGDAAVAAFMTDNDEATRQALTEANCEWAEAEALMVDVEDKPGTLANVTRALAGAGVNVHGVLVVQSMGAQARLAIAVDDAMKARQALVGAGAMVM